ncbi:MAG: response regulator [Kiritimatiellae bacterium]|nr:response regulator [Kiritimatiellia bacterium]
MSAVFIVADGSPDRRKALCRTLHASFSDAKIREADTGPEALTLVMRHSPDILIADSELPEMDDVQLCRQIRAQRPAGDTMILLMVPAQADGHHCAQALECGAEACLSRPFEDYELVAHLRALLRIREAESRIHAHEQKFQDELQRRQRTEDELKKLTASAQSLDEAKTRFLAQMSHEIRTPMNAIIGLTEVLLDTELNSEQRDIVNTIRNGGESLLTIINDILTFTKIETAGVELESRPVDVRELVERTVQLFQKNAEKKNLSLEFDIRRGLPRTLLGDAVRLRQVLSNLINNAIKFTEQGSIRVHIGGTHQSRHRFELHGWVRDTGIGIPDSHLPRLFQPFSQGDASISRRYGGSGLGLAICRRLVEGMGGRIWVRSAPGSGSVVHFTAMMNLEQEPVQAAPPAFHDSRLVLVFPRGTLLTRMKQICARWHIATETARDPAHAAALLSSGEYAAALVYAPEVDEHCAEHVLQLQGAAPVPHFPIILITPHAGESTGAISSPAPWIAALPPDSTPSDLQDALAAALGECATPPSRKSASPEWPSAPSDLRLLVAEDNEINLKVMDLLLRRMGWKPDFVRNGRQAVQAVIAHPYDFVLMDIQMPDVDGMEATACIRSELPAARQPRIIALTAHAMKGDRENCLAAGMDDYLSKPIREQALRAVLIRHWPAARPPS